jgi:hypothetical protein
VGECPGVVASAIVVFFIGPMIAIASRGSRGRRPPIDLKNYVIASRLRNHPAGRERPIADSWSLASERPFLPLSPEMYENIRISAGEPCSGVGHCACTASASEVLP